MTPQPGDWIEWEELLLVGGREQAVKFEGVVQSEYPEGNCYRVAREVMHVVSARKILQTKTRNDQ